MDADFLLMRSEDLVVLGMRCSGFHLAEDTPAGSPPVLEATGDDARVVLAFPPQHVAEQVSALGSEAQIIDGFTVWRSRLSGPSRIAFRVSSGQRMAVSVEGVLGALNGVPIWVGDGSGADHTAIELPWRLLVHPAGGTAAGCYHPARQIESLDGVVGLWSTRVRNILAGIPADHGLKVFPIDAAVAGAADPFPMPLTTANRQTIVTLGRQTGAPTERLGLSALGGSLSVKGRWDTFEWDHDTILGRDQRVRTLSKGRCYPFGHRAEYAELTERIFDPRSPDHVVTLRKQYVLKIAEPALGPADDAELARTFPFHEVEIAQGAFPDLDEPTWRKHVPPSLDRAVLEARAEEAHREEERLRRRLIAASGWQDDGSPPGSGTSFWDVYESFADLPEYAPWARARARTDEIGQAIWQLDHLPGGHPGPLPVCFPPERQGRPVLFPVRLHGGGGTVDIAVPLIFVADVSVPDPPAPPLFQSLTDPEVHEIAEVLFQEAGGGEVALPGVSIDLLNSGRRQPGDLHEVHGITIAARALDESFRATLPSFRIALPALRTLLGEPDRPPVNLTFTEQYVTGGDAVDVVFEMAAVGEKIGIDFTNRADRSGGLISPKLEADGISRLYGPVQKAGVVAAGVGNLDPSRLFAPGATLLGFDLVDLIGEVKQPPTIVSELLDGQPPVVRMRWEAVPLKKHLAFETAGNATLDLSVESSAVDAVATCTVRNFALLLPPGGAPLLRLTFESVKCTQRTGHAPTLDVTGVSAEFLGPLKLLQALQGNVGAGLGGAEPNIDVSSNGIVARYAVPVPEASVGAFVMRNIVFHAGVDVPFKGDPVTVSLAFASRERPFNLTVLGLGGGGYVDLQIDHRGLRRLEASLEFGAVVAINFLVASAEVHAVGGIRYAMDSGGAISLTGFIRIGGSVDVLGLVSVSVELAVGLSYESEGNRLYGRATLVVEIDLTLYSDSVELDSGEWVISGDERLITRGEPRLGEPAAFLPGSARPPAEDVSPASWQAYRKAFVS